MRDGGLGPLRQRDPDPVAAPDSERGERVREPIRVVGQLAEADAPRDLATVGDEDRDGVARLPLADVDADVHRRRHAPAEAGVELLVAQAHRRSSRAR